MDMLGWLSLASIVMAGMTIAIGSIAPAIGEAKVAVAALDAIARQPEQRGTITRTLFVCLAMVESTAIYCLVISLILLFANPLLETVVK